MMSLITNRKPGYDESRAKKTIEFCDIPQGAIVLDIAETNALSQQLAKEKGIEVINTVSDLDSSIIPQRSAVFKYVTCFEVIEHLMNPKLFFDNLHRMTTDDVIVYLSYPSRPKWLWNDNEHFHEYDKIRFDYLLSRTNWQSVEQKKIYIFRLPTGIRPIIRNFIPQTILYKIVKKMP
jgi:2-polyprenyl-3-methyl-5-hydroxy-6-metoxy-1,4-benzoquinol methylase